MQYSQSSVPFNISHAVLDDLGLPPIQFATQDDFMEDFVFVIAFSSKHFQKGLIAISRVQEFFPHHKILVYDIGLNETEVSFVSMHRSFISSAPSYNIDVSTRLYSVPVEIIRVISYRW